MATSTRNILRSILVPLDGSPFGEHALPLALSLARRSGAGLQIVHVHQMLTPLYSEFVLAYDTTLDPVRRKNEQAYLDEVVERLKKVLKTPVHAALLEDSIYEALEEEVKTTGADLVVMTTHGRGPLARAWLGSVADRLVRHLAVPILLVRPEDAKVDWGTEAGVQHVLIALDGSKLSEQIIEPAVTVGTLLGANYTLVRVIEPPVLGQYDPAVMRAGIDPWILEELQASYQTRQKEATGYLESVAAPLRARSCQVETRVLAREQPAVAILDEVKVRSAGLVALATHGRGGLPRLFLGSVADKVVRGAHVPVLLIRPQGE